MAPSTSTIVRGMAFVVIGPLKQLSDRWLLETTAEGKNEVHNFNHVLVLVFVQQFVQMGLLLLYYAIERNWLGCKRFNHGNIYRENPNHGLGYRTAPTAMENPVSINADDDNGGELNGQMEARDEEEEREREARRKRKQRYRMLVYLLPAVFHLIQSLLMHFGLELTYSSSFMMLKGTLMIFTALFAIAFLAQQLTCHAWIGILLSCAGFVVCGISDYINRQNVNVYEKYGSATGSLLITMSQIFIAFKFVYEEKYLRKHWIHPMKFLGAEAVYGFVLTGIVLLVFCLVPVADYYSYVIPKTNRLEDVKDAVIQLGNSRRMIAAFVCSVVLQIVWSYLGLFMIRDHGALPRVMVETLVWVLYWAVCLALTWENFVAQIPVQVPGLCAIPVGLLLYANILPLPSFCGPRVSNVNHNGIFLNRGLHRYDQLNEQYEEGEDGDDVHRHEDSDSDEDNGGSAANNEVIENHDHDDSDGNNAAADESNSGDEERFEGLGRENNSRASFEEEDDDDILPLEMGGDETPLVGNSRESQDVPLLQP